MAASDAGVATATADPRDQLWNASFVTDYDPFLEEMLADHLIKGWGRLDDLTKIIVSLTASESAISGGQYGVRQAARPCGYQSPGLPQYCQSPTRDEKGHTITETYAETNFPGRTDRAPFQSAS